MSKRKKHHEEEEHVNHERWLITYADMITLLMVLFIVLFAIGQTDLKKFSQLAGGLSSSLGGAGSFGAGNRAIPGGDGILSGGKVQRQAVVIKAGQALRAQKALDEIDKSLDDKIMREARLRAVEEKINVRIISSGFGEDVTTRLDPERGLVVSIAADKALFSSGSASLSAEGIQVLDQISSVLIGLPNAITVEGHTDNQPIASQIFPSNWELSTGRAGTVLRYLASKGVDENKLRAAGYADKHPVAPNDTEQNRRRNRRVEIVILASTTKLTEEKQDG